MRHGRLNQPSLIGYDLPTNHLGTFLTGQHIDFMVAYRAFRARTLPYSGEKARDGGLALYGAFDPTGDLSSTARAEIEAFRIYLCANAEQLLSAQPADERYLRHALGIPPGIPLVRRRDAVWRRGVRCLVPVSVQCGRARGLLVQVRTYQGRHLIYENLIAPDLVWNVMLFSRVTFSRELDFILRHLPLPRSREDLANADRVDVYWLRIAHRFDYRDASVAMAWDRVSSGALEGQLAWMMVSTGVVSKREEIEWINYTPDSAVRWSSTVSGGVTRARRTINLLLGAGVPRRDVAGLFKHDLGRLDPNRLAVNLNVLRGFGVDAGAVHAACGELLWTAEPANWSYVLGTLGVHTPTDIGQFGALLESRYDLSTVFGSALAALGAGDSDLALCERLIIAVSRQGSGDAAVRALHLLVFRSQGVSVAQVAQCADYLVQPEALADYLAVLARHGFTSATSIVRFHACYRRLTPVALDAWLMVLDSTRGQQSDEQLADLVRRLGDGGYIDEYRCLVQMKVVVTLTDVVQAIPIVHLGRGMLEYLIMERGMVSISALRSWYYAARGLNGGVFHQDDAVGRLLRDDAFSRNDFIFLCANEKEIVEAVHSRVSLTLGDRPFRANEATRRAYDEAYARRVKCERAALVDLLPHLLGQTGGVLLRSVLMRALTDGKGLESTLARMRHTMGSLLVGVGPVGSALDELEVDAISLLYRTPRATVEMQWPHVVGRQGDLAGWRLQESYPMAWRRSQRRFEGKLEVQSWRAMGHAAGFAVRFLASIRDASRDFSNHLSPHRIDDPARDPWSLHAHLGVLLAASVADSTVEDWMNGRLARAAEMADAQEGDFEVMEQLDAFFGSSLPDALDRYSPGFVALFDQCQAARLAGRLVRAAATSDGDGNKKLEVALEQTRSAVLKACRGWLGRERRKFAVKRCADAVTNLSAVLSKHPSVFFSKHTANLCTRDNTAMWNETRQAHLVVFDPVRQRLAGMALVNAEVIPSLDASRKCLVIRALNPMADMLATHTAASIVDAFFEVALIVARENALAAVAFPSANGSHLLSNLSQIERDLKRRFQEPAKRARFGSADSCAGGDQDLRAAPRMIEHRFFAFEDGVEPVDTLFVIWVDDATSRVGTSTLSKRAAF